MKREKAIYLPLSATEKKTLQDASKAVQMNQREYLRSLLYTLEITRKSVQP